MFKVIILTLFLLLSNISYSKELNTQNIKVKENIFYRVKYDVENTTMESSVAYGVKDDTFVILYLKKATDHELENDLIEFKIKFKY